MQCSDYLGKMGGMKEKISHSESDKPQQKKPTKNLNSDKKDRLEVALRENLLRRKASSAPKNAGEEV